MTDLENFVNQSGRDKLVKDVRKKIDELGILKEATKNSKSFLKNWFKLLGFKTVNYSEL